VSAGRSDNYLVISDLQIPFENPKALEFCKYLRRHFGIPLENVYNVGDEVDQYFGSLYDKDPDALHTPNSEIRESIDKLSRWYDAFPMMKLALSNHGERWAKKASKAGIPSIMLKGYQEVLQSPSGWRWERVWRVEARYPFLVKHGLEYGGMYTFKQAPMVEGMSVVFGHHTNAGIAFVETEGLDAWGMCVSCLIDPVQYAFHYSKYNRFKPNLGCGVILNGGKLPIWVPLE
jgi:hypothetical protein